MNSILKYPGGQHYMAPEIVSMMQPHRIYFETCFGGGSVFFRKQGSHVACDKNILTDLNPEVTNFFKFVRDYPAIFVKSAREIQYCRKAFEIWRDDARADPCTMMSALRFFVLSRMSRGGLGKDFSESIRLRGELPEGENAYQNAISGIFDAAVALGFCQLEVMSVFDPQIVKHLGNPDALYYIDPPYVDVGEKLYGAFGMFDHAQLLYLVTQPSVRAKIMISGYDSELYRKMLTGGDWRLRKFEKSNRQGQGDALNKVTHVIWKNFM